MSSGPADFRRCSAEELATLALAGHTSAWDEIVRRYSHRVVVALLARGVGLEAAEDLAQETWLRLVQQQRTGRLRALVLPGLALAQARWLAREAERTRARREALVGRALPLKIGPLETEAPDLAVDPERQTLQRLRLEMVESEVERCPARAREVFRAVYGEHAVSHAEVARELGLSVQRVRQILCEVRARVRVVIGDLEGEDEHWHI